MEIINHIENSSLTIAARLTDRQNNIITADEVQYIDVLVWDVDNQNELLNVTLEYGDTEGVEDYWSDTYLSWSTDDIGYNFFYTIDDQYFPAADNIYQVEFRFRMVDGNAYKIRRLVKTGQSYFD